MPRDRYLAGSAILGARYALVHDDRLFESDGFLAGSDDARLKELEAALVRPDTRAVFVARGGYGLTRILSRLSPALLSTTQKPIIGFSDVTALHAARIKAGYVTIHGPVVTQVGDLDVTDIEALYTLLENPEPPPPLTHLQVLAPGTAEGPLVGGNLELVTRLVGTPHAVVMRDAVLLLEEVGESPYRIDRQLTHLVASGALQGVRAILLGDFVRCDTPSPPAALAVLTERLGSLGIPVLADLPIGHGTRNRAVALGARVRVNAADGSVVFLEGAVT